MATFDASDMEALLNRVGLPEDIAAVALEDIEEAEENEPVPSVTDTVGAMAGSMRSLRLKGFVGAAMVLVLVLVAVVSVAATHHSKVPRTGRTPSTTAPPIGSDGSTPSRLTVPNVIGMSVAQAQVELQSADLSVKVVSGPSSSVPGGSVFSQGPVAGFMNDPAS